jgi:putative SOS response-associated peptidase YedK
MCGRYTLTSPEDIAARFGLGALAETRIEPRFNVAPSQGVPVIVGRENGPALTTMRWGFQPAWMKSSGQRPPPINARSESLLERPMFRGAVAHGRCLIPADGFYEWMVVPGRKTKQPMYIRLKGGPLFAFAGLYVQGKDDVGETCVIVTTAANEVISSIHERMPVILDRSVEMEWLDRDLEDGRAALAYLQPVSPDQFEVYPVSSQVSSARNDGPDLIEPLEGAVLGVPRLL